MEVDMTGEKGRKKVNQTDADEVREILTVVSDKVPALVKGLVTSVFSEDAAKGMGKAAAAYYQELKAGGMPDAVAIQMTKEYIGTFTHFSEMFRTGAREVQRGIKVEIDDAKRRRQDEKQQGRDEDTEEES